MRLPGHRGTRKDPALRAAQPVLAAPALTAGAVPAELQTLWSRDLPSLRRPTHVPRVPMWTLPQHLPVSIPCAGADGPFSHTSRSLALRRSLACVCGRAEYTHDFQTPPRWLTPPESTWGEPLTSSKFHVWTLGMGTACWSLRTCILDPGAWRLR